MLSVASYFEFLEPLNAPSTGLDPFISHYSKGEMRSVSQAAFAWKVLALGGRLAARGVRAEDVVLIFVHAGIPAIEAFFACQAIGATPSFMPPPSPRQPHDIYISSHRAVCERVAPSLIIFDRRTADEIGEALGRPAVVLEDVDAAVQPMGFPAAPAPDAVALLQHSSGTTGLKKGVMLNYEAVTRQLASYAEALSLPEDATVVSWLPVYHDMGLVACTLLPVVLQRPLFIVDPFEWLTDPTRTLVLASQASRPLMWLPNFAFNHLATHARRLARDVNLSHLYAVINCSEPCRPDSMERFAKAYEPFGLNPAAIQTCYALAENVFAASQTKIGTVTPTLAIDRAAYEAGAVAPAVEGAPYLRIASCGYPVSGTKIAIRNAEGREAEPEEIGQVWLTGACLFDGYFKQPSLTEQRMSGGWLNTRDVGFMRDGQLYVCGRVDDLIIVNGKNLLAHDIEAGCGDIIGIKSGRVVAFGHFTESTGSEGLVVAAELVAGAEAEDIRAQVTERVFGEFSIKPIDVVLVPLDTLVKTTSGKMSRSENRRRYAEKSLKSWSYA